MTYFLLLGIVVLILSLSGCLGNTFPTIEEFVIWADAISERVVKTANEETDIKVLTEVYGLPENRDRVVFEAIDGAHIANEGAKATGGLFGRRKEAVQNIAKHAEAFAANYSYQLGLMHGDLRYVNVKHVGRLDKELLQEDNMYPVTKITNISLAQDDNFKRSVNFSVSGVHIPLEVYEGYIEVLNALNWTAHLDGVFKANKKQDQNIHWQYFASSHGLIRIYPAFRWQTAPHVPDLYDARKRLWYAQSQSSPKDIIILLDKSGSIHGPSFEIMKITAKTILGTLGENDFFNIAQFTVNTTWLVPCFPNLVQATTANKQLFHEAIDRLTPNNKASYANALTFAFESFKKYKRINDSYDGASCSRAIFLLSDGGTEHPTSTIKKYQKDPDTSDIRIFTIAVGPHPIPTVSLKQIACLGKGHYSAIMTIGAIRSKTQEYLKVLGRPLALSHDDQLFQWSSTYEDAGGLGPTVSVTRPVFDTLSDSSDDQQLLGVAGVDIPISTVEEHTTERPLGKNVYSFALTQNGMVLFHPDLTSHVNVLEDPLLIDILDLEPDTPNIEDIRKEMIDRQSGSKKVEVPVFSGDYAYRETRTYHYRPIGNSTYSFALVIPDGHMRMTVTGDATVSNATLLDLKNRMILRERNASLLIAPWAQCSFGNSLKVSTVESADGVAHIFDRTLNKCDTAVVQHLFWDLEIAVSAIKSSWGNRTHSKATSRFIATDGGIALVQNQRSSFISSSLSDIHKNAVYQRISKSETDVVAGIVSKVEDGQLKVKSVVGSRVLLEDTETKRKQIVAAAGAELPPYHFRRIMFEETQKDGKSMCSDKEEIRCFLLDEGGHVVASNQDKIPPGSFLGIPQADPQLMTALVTPIGTVFEQVIRHQPLSACPKWVSSDKCSSAAMRSPLQITTQSFGRMMKSFTQNTFTFMQYLLVSVFTWILPLVGYKEVEAGNALTEIGLVFLRPPKITTRLCSTRSAYYRLLLKQESEPVHGVFRCPDVLSIISPSVETNEILNISKRSVTPDTMPKNENEVKKVFKKECTREILVKRLIGSNLVMVVAQPECPCETRVNALLHAPIEDTETKVCNSTGRYRRKLALCYATDTKEKFQKCNIPQSNAAWSWPNFPLILFFGIYARYCCS